MKEKKLRAVIYCRIATENKADDGLALKRQCILLRHQAACGNLDIVGEIRAYEKGITLNRPGWREALNLAAESQADVILVTKYDRVARGLPLLEQAVADMDKRGLKLYTSMESFPFLKGHSK